ncbi:hypothetical protein OXYTRIMIC_106 [Oxytricha trifallax]|uniref:Uncharacterized protein n=1 Tax=Oxytricha trifallax TaxID=1172189 RepID=A0A073I0R2_9SPIT|nr:hypothetical protein OXYTRIMIC_106 [Oxytricha trifallax]
MSFHKNTTQGKDSTNGNSGQQIGSVNQGPSFSFGGSSTFNGATINGANMASGGDIIGQQQVVNNYYIIQNSQFTAYNYGQQHYILQQPLNYIPYTQQMGFGEQYHSQDEKNLPQEKEELKGSDKIIDSLNSEEIVSFIIDSDKSYAFEDCATFLASIQKFQSASATYNESCAQYKESCTTFENFLATLPVKLQEYSKGLLLQSPEILKQSQSFIASKVNGDQAQPTATSATNLACDELGMKSQDAKKDTGDDDGNFTI